MGGSLPYDCEAGYSTWKAVWSEPKKRWCCARQQKGCPERVPSGRGCDTPCLYHGMTATCKDRISYAAKHFFSHSDDSCRQAHSRVQRECHICEACTIAAQCGGTSASIPYDCAAGLVNWRVAWSPGKKIWCCSHEKKGC